MSENYHTPYADGVTEFRAADMNAPLGELDAAIGDIRGPQYYDFMGQYLGDVLNSNALLMQGIVARYMVLPLGAPGSELYTDTAPAAEAVFVIKRNDAQIGTITVAAGQHTGVFSVAADIAFYNSDLLQLYGPNPADGSLQDVSWNLILSRPDLLTMTTTTTTTTTTSTTTT